MRPMPGSKRFIRHRVNGLSEIGGLEPGWGAEIDLRASERGIYLAHDPWAPGADFDEWLAAYARLPAPGTLILNVKEDGLEAAAAEHCRRHGVTDFFFLDSTLPTLVRLSSGEESSAHLAVRLSSYEPVALARAFAGRAGWLWIDCFEGEPLPASVVEPLRADFKLCLVSPELQRQPLESIARFDALYELCDAICTKAPAAWITHFSNPDAS